MSLFCLVYLSPGAIRWPSELLSSILRLLLDLDTLIFFCMFPPFRKKVADIIAPKRSIIFRGLISLGVQKISGTKTKN